MGNSESGALYLHLTTRNIQAGQDVSGYVYMVLESDVRAGGLSLKLKGKERCRHTPASFLCLFRPLFTVCREERCAGEACTPAHLPGTFALSIGSVSALIRYTLRAFLTTGSTVLRPKTELVVRTFLTDSITALGGGVLARVQTCCCWSQGAVQIRVGVNKSAYVPGEPTEIDVELDNSLSRVTVTGIQGTLSRVVRLRSDWGFTKTDISVLTEAVDYRAIPPGHAQSRFHLSLLVQDFYGNLQNATSARGQRVECQYVLRVKALVAGCWMCCGESPQVEKTLIIYPLQVPQQLPPQELAPRGDARGPLRDVHEPRSISASSPE